MGSPRPITGKGKKKKEEKKNRFQNETRDEKKKEVAEWKLSTNNKVKEACAFAEKLRMITRSPYTIEKKKKKKEPL